jgi:hypothetical protein
MVMVHLEEVYRKVIKSWVVIVGLNLLPKILTFCSWNLQAIGSNSNIIDEA